MRPRDPILVVEVPASLPIDRLGPLLRESEAAGLRLVRRLVDEWTDGTTHFDRPGEALFVARYGAAIAGVCGLSRDPYGSSPTLGRVRHLYVLIAHRRRGVGRHLVHAVLGFRRRDDDPACTHVLHLR